MADSKISGLPSGVALTGSEEVPIVQSGSTVKTTTQDIADLVSSDNLGTSDLTSTDNNRNFTLNGSLFTNSFTVENSGGVDYFQVTGNGKIGIGGVADNTRTARVYGDFQADARCYVGTGGNAFIDGSTTNLARYGGTALVKHRFTNNGTTSQFEIYPAGNTITTNDGMNYVYGTTTGSKIGTATNQKIGFWNSTPVIQPTTGITAGTFVANTSGISDDSATFDGYTIGQIAAALRQIGILA
jgi:hypothetical protein